MGELSWLTATWLREHLLVLRDMAVDGSGLLPLLARGEEYDVAAVRTQNNVDTVLATIDRERARVVISTATERQTWVWTLVELGMSIAVRMGVPWEVVQQDPDAVEDHCDRLVARLGRWLTGLADELAGVADWSTED